MKIIGNLTEEQAVQVAAQVITRRATRGARIERDTTSGSAFRFQVEVETFTAEEET
jgi:hypothetical protein